MTPLGRQSGASIALILVVLVLAILAGAAGTYIVLQNLNVTLALRDQPARAIVQQQIRGVGTVDDAIQLRLTETIRTQVPVDQNVTIPVKDTLNIVAHFDGTIPLRMQVRLQDTIPLKQVVKLDTTVEAYLPSLDTRIKIPLRGEVPIDTQVPVDLTIPVDQNVALSFVTPVTARIDQSLTVPLKTTIDAEVPIDAAMSVPVLNELQAIVHLPETPSDVVITEADLTLPLQTLKLDWTEKARAQQ